MLWMWLWISPIRSCGQDLDPGLDQCPDRLLNLFLESGFKDSDQKVEAIKLAKKPVKSRNKKARQGEAGRVIPTLKPKHSFSASAPSDKPKGDKSRVCYVNLHVFRV